ncbi:MAG: hypothetical protein SCALA702_22020 [Melioribacteraceae bacterium]|nr:MAG: hypothetical protein SCALA702_22020 [Melioribacteraceae bacterium]
MYRDDYKNEFRGILTSSVLDDIGIAFCTTTLDGKILTINRTFLEMFEYTSYSEVENLNFREHFYTNPGSRDAILNLLGKKNIVKNYRLLLQKKDGGKVYTQVTKKLVRDNGRDVIETSIKDISDTILKEYELKKEIKELKSGNTHHTQDSFSNELKFRYLRGIGHGVRTPVTSLLGYLTMLENKLYKSNEEYNEILNDSKSVVTKLNETVNNLIDLTRIETGNIQLYAEKFDIKDEITSIETALITLYGDSGSVIFRVEKSIPAVLRGDNLRYRQVLIGLLKYLREVFKVENITIDIKSHFNKGKNQKISTVIGFRAIGSNLDEIERLKSSFDSRRELNNIEEQNLGFFIANEYIRALGGNLEVNVGEDSGTLQFSSLFFMEQLPNSTKENESESSTGTNNNIGNDGLNDNADKKILLVEDDKGNRGVEEKILRNAGYYVYSTGSGREAVKELEKNDYDIVLMDIAMEDIDGISATKMIRNFSGPKGEIPVIAVTAHCSMQDREKCLEAGMNDYISKPINFKYLKLTIEQWIKKSERKVVNL